METTPIKPGMPVNHKPPKPSVPGMPFECWWDKSRESFLVKNNNKKWQYYSERDVGKMLGKLGKERSKDKETGLSVVDDLLLQTKHICNVDFAIQVAGYEEGWHMICGRNVLVTEGPVLIEWQPGDWPNLKRLFEGLFIDPKHPEDKTQLYTFYAWVKLSYKCLYMGPEYWHPGQALILAGPPGCGKSWTQNIITYVLGGRCSKPYQYMMGRTDFNSEMIKTEHLMLEDEASTDNYDSRQNFGSSIKQFTVNEVQPVHGKCKDKFELLPFWRVTGSVNDAPAHLNVLPPLDNSIKDKIIILRCYPPPIPFPPRMELEGRLFGQAILTEIPKWIRWLWHDFQVPEEMKDNRYGVWSYHNPEIAEAINEMSPEAYLEQLIDQYVMTNGEDWEGRASDLEDAFSKVYDPLCSKRIGVLLKHRNSCSMLLMKLASKPNSRVTYHRTKIARFFKISGHKDPKIQVDDMGDIDL